MANARLASRRSLSEEWFELKGRMVESTIAKESNVETSSGVPSHASESLPRRDYLILPLLSIVTILLLFGTAEGGARILWPQREFDDCLNYSIVDPRYRPNCTSQAKDAEDPKVTYHYNECGYRTAANCGPKRQGTARIVLLGSSNTQGQYVPYDEIFATRTGNSVARDLQRVVEIENISAPYVSPLICYRRISEVTLLEPDLVVLSLAPGDLWWKIDPELLIQSHSPSVHINQLSTAGKDFSFLPNFPEVLVNHLTAVKMTQHYLFQDTDFFIRVSLAGGDRLGYLQRSFAPSCEARFSDLKTLVVEMAAKLRARQIPLLVVAIPSRIEAALLNAKRRQAQLDPFAFGNRIREIAEDADATYVDLMRPFSLLPRPEDLYFPVNLHPTSEGHEAIARELIPAVERILISRNKAQGRIK